MIIAFEKLLSVFKIYLYAEYKYLFAEYLGQFGKQIHIQYWKNFQVIITSQNLCLECISQMVRVYPFLVSELNLLLLIVS